MSNEILPNGIIKIEKGSKNWYEEITQNFEIIDSLIADVRQNIQKIQNNKDVNDTQETSITDLNTAIQELQTVVNAIVVPTKVSELDNDAEFISSVTWDSIQNKPSRFEPDAHNHTIYDISDFPSIPTKVSDLDNDSEFITDSDLTNINSAISDIQNRLTALENQN